MGSEVITAKLASHLVEKIRTCFSWHLSTASESGDLGSFKVKKLDLTFLNELCGFF